jgi:uncharacterized protein YkwD
MRRTSALVAYMAVATALLCPTAASASSADAEAEAQAIASLNEIRAANGLSSLRSSTSLANSSGAYARYMLRNDFFGHQARIRVARQFRTAGETLAWHSGWSAGPRRTVRQWMNSPPHRAVLMSSAFRQVGMGMERGRLGGQATTMWVAHFGRR